ncbi:hypothetical protein CHLNCDRAFT_133936 [Chlorella variabilis]|uniref:Mitochondrial Rho GTPase n=1 Tax=Chlorella variabilis TaxID=554065 RepID=E1ZEL9_CHLVA|nr:hypothetical protein CHLNCDRAFT_133936 [Chlorella variabilis]EFN55684.1 hypothetical protein CHLNCDRAFT_133936 [Chlorella variabilis]|eukprot:XP_005847786.1 hypothetical protein CHLNCDRAFT_133936 [Chlorella variabilis]
MASLGGPNTVHICVVGDEGVGKTSLITAAATETFPDHPPPVLPPARLPADTTPEGVPVVITDTSSRPEDKQSLELSCQEASVIVLCFSADRPGTLRRISSYWMPELRRLGVHVPVMLVGCKSDVRTPNPVADRGLQEAVLPIVKAYPQIETCMECSAKKLQFVGEVFYYALKAVVHPMAPLYEPESQKLRPLCAKALKRIFLLCDKDKASGGCVRCDGVLNDGELNAFQVLCFNAPLQAEELEEMFSTAPADPWASLDYEGLLVERSRKGLLTLNGFLALWAVTTAGSPRHTLAYAYYLGYPEDAPADRLFQVSRPRRQERRADAPRRGVLQCFLFAPGTPGARGFQGVDATPVLEGLIAQARPAHGSLAGPIHAAAAAVGGGGGGEPGTTLILRSVTEEQAQVLQAEELLRCDVAAFLFDASQPGSFEAARERMLAVATASGDALPCLFLQANDNEATPQLAERIGAACSELAVRLPASYTLRPSAAAYQAIALTAQQPELAIPETPSLKAARQYRRMLRRGLLYAGAGTTLVLAGYLGWKLWKDRAAGGGGDGGKSGGGGGGGGGGSSGAPSRPPAAAAAGGAD